MLSGLVADGAAYKVGVTCYWFGGGERVEWDIPQAIGCISRASDDYLSVFEYFEIVFSKEGNAIVVAELSDRDEGACLEVIEDVPCLCVL